tara:strand:+ start:235 stop:420 length:186 start_codon:yes stop_codon:yes gene_type:complete
MTVANELDAVIEELAVNQRQAAKELVEEIQTRPEGDQLLALRELIEDRLRALDVEEEGEDE